MEQDTGWVEQWHGLRLTFLALLLIAFIVTYLINSKSSSPQSTQPLAKEEKSQEPVLPTQRTVVRNAPKRIQGSKKALTPRRRSQDGDEFSVQPLVFFSSLTGSTEAYAKQVVQDLNATSLKPARGRLLKPQLHDLSYVEFDDYFLSAPKAPENDPSVQHFYIILIPTYNIDTILNTFLDHLRETHHDFRVDTGPLSDLLGYSVFGFGDKEGWPTEEEGYCSQAKEIDKWMARLTNKKRAYPLGMGDVKGSVREDLKDWQEGLFEVLASLAEGSGLGEGVVGSGDAVESGDEEMGDEEEEESSETASTVSNTKRSMKPKSSPTMADLEDLGSQARRSAGPSGKGGLVVDFTTFGTKTSKSEEAAAAAAAAAPTIKPMVPKDSPTYAALTKQGYSIIGSHSGVKICRWTKSALRGRGSCYKRSFYGIASHLCMEATPALSCSNKCVFCWRHGTNPVGTTWRWEVDEPEMILEGALDAHVKKIKVMKGVPGIRADRFAQAMRVKHCALSLVGEPIFYPRINEFLRLLHAKRISSFLVCNAQHPAQLEALEQVTQLYVSIDASNKDSLRKIDRPLHRDFWERFQHCLDILREKRFRQRTVFRLTLVKGFNVEDEVEGYAELVARGLPCFVEIKGVTYCGTSSAAGAGLTMQNVPFWAEVQEFVVALNAALARRGLEYGMAAEHAHSCCALLASTRFRREGRWHTLIDYGRFFELLEGGGEFGPEDYMGEPTPEWAGWGKGGFDPLDVRTDRKGRPVVQEVV